MLKKLYLDSNIPINEWSEMLLDAQWKNATEVDYEINRQQLVEEEKEWDY
jgi:homospermidine synthase